MSRFMARRVLIAPIDIVIIMVVSAVVGAHFTVNILFEDEITVQQAFRYALFLVMLAMGFFVFFSACLEVHDDLALGEMVDRQHVHKGYVVDGKREGDEWRDVAGRVPDEAND